MSVEAGKKLVLDPETGERLGLKPNEEGLYVLDGGKDATKVAVKVGKEDVYLSKEHAEALGIKKNAKGLYVIPGAGYKSDGSSSSSSSSSSSDNSQDLDEKDIKDVLDNKKKFNDLFNADVGAFNKELLTQLDTTALGGMKNMAERAIKRATSKGFYNEATKSFETMTYKEAYNEFVLKPITQGVVMFEEENFIWVGEDKAFPKYWFNYFQDNIRNAEKDEKGQPTPKEHKEEIQGVLSQIESVFGYGKEDTKKIVEIMMN
jgi:hypothetical protein